MIKYGIGGRPLKKESNKEIVLTDHGLVKRDRDSQHKDNTANEIAKKIAAGKKSSLDAELLSKLTGRPVKDCMTDEERFFKQIEEEGGLKRV